MFAGFPPRRGLAGLNARGRAGELVEGGGARILATMRRGMTSVLGMEGSKMRRAGIVTLVLFFACFAASAAASAQEVKHRKPGGTVTAVDDAAKTFTCHWKTKEWTFKT